MADYSGGDRERVPWEDALFTAAVLKMHSSGKADDGTRVENNNGVKKDMKMDVPSFAPPAYTRRAAAPAKASTGGHAMCVSGCQHLEDTAKEMIGCDSVNCRHGEWFHLE